MSRSWSEGECDDLDSLLRYGRWRGQVTSAIRGERGQRFLRELATAMDAMPEKALISGDLVTSEGECCAIGVICKARGLDVSDVDPDDHESVADMVGIAHQLSSEIAWENDEGGYHDQTPEERWVRMRKWVEARLKKAEP